MTLSTLPLDRPADRPTVSVVIPVKNEAAHIETCLQAILSQEHAVLEIIVIDSGSDDDTVARARRFPKVRVLEIPAHEFNHGGTRNRAVSETSGAFVVCTVGDAYPVDSAWLSSLLQGFVNPEIRGVCGAQIVPSRPDTNPIDWFHPVNRPRLTQFHYPEKGGFAALSPEERLAACRWDNVTAAYRRDALLNQPFPVITYGEDILWAVESYEAGHALAYQPAARVYHYHAMTPQASEKRTVITVYLRYALLGLVPESFPFVSNLLKCVWRLVRNDQLSWGERIYWLRYNAVNTHAIRTGLNRCRQHLRQGPEAFKRFYETYTGSPPIPDKPAYRARQKNETG